MSATSLYVDKAERLTEFLAGDDTLADGAVDTLTGLLFVTVVGGAVKETVASLDGVVDGLRERLDGCEGTMYAHIVTSAVWGLGICGMRRQ